MVYFWTFPNNFWTFPNNFKTSQLKDSLRKNLILFPKMFPLSVKKLINSYVYFMWLQCVWLKAFSVFFTLHNYS